MILEGHLKQLGLGLYNPYHTMYCEMEMYADDTTIYLIHSDVELIEKKNALMIIFCW